MILGGTGGSRTVTGLHFEKKADFLEVIKKVDGYTADENGKIFFQDKLVAIHLRKNALYRYLEERGVNHEAILSRRLLPDDALYVLSTNTLFVIEMKFQQVAGSVDEKLQTAAFKKSQYLKLVGGLGMKVQYYYLLNDWFKDPGYRDVLDFIRRAGCDYFFETIPLGSLDLPDPSNISAS